MSDTSAEPQHESLDIGSIIGETFATLRGNIVAVLILCGIPSLVSLLLTWGLFGAAFITGDFTEEPASLPAGIFVSVALLSVLSMAIYGLALALCVQLAHDFKFGEPVQVARYFQTALASLVPIVVVTIAVSLLAGIGFVLLIVPGLWIYAVYSVAIPAIVIERAGLGAMGRSIALTKEYRWPIVLLMVICGIITIVFSTIGTLLAEFIPGGIVIDLVVSTIVYGIAYGVFGILMFLIYARLREIKEGVGVKDVVSVFE